MRLLLLAVVALVACGGDDDDEAAGTVATVTETSDDSASTTPPSTTRGPLVPASSQPELETSVPAPAPPPSGPVTAEETAAITDLATREGVDAAAITTVAVENVTWRDSAIGCPEPGVAYMQVLTDGMRIVLELDGTRYEYHGGGARPPFLCENPEPPVGE